MDILTIIIAGGIILAAIVVAVLLANRSGWRHSELKTPDAPIEHYTEMRDTLTTGYTATESTFGGGGMFMELAIAAIGIGVVVMVGYLVLANVKAAIPDATNVTTIMSSTASTVTSGFALVAVGIIVLAGFGMISIFRD
jgi:hypothetical protein